MTIRPARTEDLAAVREIFREYAAWVGDAICFAAFERELAELPGRYAPPGGALLLAFSGAELAGCAALRQLDGGTGEMKRLYVRAGVRGQGAGRDLVEAVVAEARALGYERLVLDTLPRMESAIGLYSAMGFQPILPYGENPAGALCFELRLKNS